MLSDEQIDRLQIESEAAYKRSRGRVSGQQMAPSDSPDWWFARAIETAACAERDQRIAELEQELEAVRKDAERKHNALKEAGLFLHHAWCDVQMNEYSFERLNRAIEIVDAAIDAAKERT